MIWFLVKNTNHIKFVNNLSFFIYSITIFIFDSYFYLSLTFNTTILLDNFPNIVCICSNISIEVRLVFLYAGTCWKLVTFAEPFRSRSNTFKCKKKPLSNLLLSIENSYLFEQIYFLFLE